MEWWFVRASVLVLFLVLVCVGFSWDRIWGLVRRKFYTRGAELDRRGRDTIKPGERKWGTHGVSKEECLNHFVAAGRSDSGKSLLLQRLMADVAKSITPGSDRRIFLYDAKNEMVPYLKRLGVGCPVWSVNPLEKRQLFPNSVRWEIRRDVDCIATAENFAYKIIPEDTGQNRYFSDGARLLVSGLCESFTRHSPDQWTFSDLVFASLNPERLVTVLERDPHGMNHLEGLMKEGRTAYQVFTTLYSRMSRYRPAAGLWQRAQEGISLRDWVHEESIIIFGSNARIRKAVNPLYEVLFATLVEEMDELHDCSSRETWCWLDEIRLCEPVIKSDMLNYFATKARSKGGIMVLGFQSYPGLKKVLGEEQADELLGQCENQAYLWYSSIKDAKWASEQVGEKETLETFRSSSGEIGSRTRSRNETRVMKQAILPSEFVKFGKPNPQKGIQGVFIKGGEHPKLRVVPGTEFPFACTSEEKRLHGIHRRDSSEQEMIPWSIDRQKKLGIDLERDKRTLEERQEIFRKASGMTREKKKDLEPNSKKQERDQEIYAGAQKAAEQYSQTLDVSFGM